MPTVAGPVRVHDANPHCFEYRGRPVLLIASGDIYYDVFCPCQDYREYLDTLARWRCNFTRLYPAGCTAFVPSDGRGSILPWARRGDGLYDLDRWNPVYFDHLHDFMRHAAARDVIVDVCLFNGFTWAWAQINHYCWPLLPLSAANNVQREGCTDMDRSTTLAVPSNVRRQREYVRKICAELDRYDNLLYDTSDEPDCHGNIPAGPADAWVDATNGADPRGEHARPPRGPDPHPHPGERRGPGPVPRSARRLDQRRVPARPEGPACPVRDRQALRADRDLQPGRAPGLGSVVEPDGPGHPRAHPGGHGLVPHPRLGLPGGRRRRVPGAERQLPSRAAFRRAGYLYLGCLAEEDETRRSRETAAAVVEKPVLLEARAGESILLSPLVSHASGANRSRAAPHHPAGDQRVAEPPQELVAGPDHRRRRADLHDPPDRGVHGPGLRGPHGPGASRW